MIQILMSTYNGESYISEQLDSIRNQSIDDIFLLIRDDGSSDKTSQILKQYCNKYANMQCIFGENIGPTQSFFELLDHVPDDAEYIALSDQDDVWFQDKIETAVEQLSTHKEPALYCCRPLLTDEKLTPLHDHVRVPHPKPSFGNALIENICTGCTIVCNRALYELIRGKCPKHYLVHDMWLYQVASCFGTVIYDPVPHIYYRQHGNNAIGLDKGRWSLIKRQITSLGRFRGKYTAQIQEFMSMFPLDGDALVLAEETAGTSNKWSCRFRTLLDPRIYRQGFFDQILFKGMLFLGIL